MPIDLEMLLSATSHPLFAYSQFPDNGYDRFQVGSDYSDKRFNGNLPQRHFLLRSNSQQLSFIQNKPTLNKDYGKIKSKHNSEAPRKKKVSFADDRGLSLVEVRVIPEAVGATPKWADDVLSLLTAGSKPTVQQDKLWKLSSDHPPWTDEKLDELLEKNAIALESVTVDENERGVLAGTILVKNLFFEKKVFLRITFDRWVSYEDVIASYVKPKDANGKALSFYDTFAFRINIPQSASRYEVIEFCAGFKCDGEEYWDNNGGINYRLVAVPDSPKHDCSPDVPVTHKSSTPKVTFSVTANFDEYSEIDAWNRFVYDRPYW